VTFSERVAEVRDSPNSLKYKELKSYHHDNENVFNGTSMNVDLFKAGSRSFLFFFEHVAEVHDSPNSLRIE
jgi:hypothetical protein